MTHFPPGKNRETGKNSLVKTNFSNSGHFLAKFFKLTLIRDILHLYISTLCCQRKISLYLAKLDQSWPFLADFGQYQDISRENGHFPLGNFPVAISCFPFSRQETLTLCVLCAMTIYSIIIKVNSRA